MSGRRKKRNLSQQVAHALGREILNGSYARHGEFPTEAQLCARFEVSRTAVREAVKMLSAKGLIASKPRQGIRVQAAEHWNILDPDVLEWSLEGYRTQPVLKEFFQMRMAIEPEAAALAAASDDDDRRRAIGDALHRMENAAGDLEQATEADLDFHTSILYATRNRFYIRMRDFIRTALSVSISMTTPPTGILEPLLAGHAAVWDAIRSGDSARARQSMRALIADSLDQLEERDST